MSVVPQSGSSSTLQALGPDSPSSAAHIQPAMAHPALSFAVKHNERLQALAVWGSRTYFCFVFLLVANWIIQTLRLTRLRRISSLPPVELEADFSRLCTELRVRSCHLRIISSLHSPATAYWWRPVVFLPAELIPQVSREQLIDMLRHELIHVRHRDYLWERVASLACRVVFFHPAMWVAYRDLRRQRELACDLEAAGGTLEDRLRYADALLSFARWKRNKNRTTLALEFAALSSPLSARIHSLLHPPQNGRRQAVYTLCVSVSALAVLLAILPALSIGLTWSVEKVTTSLPLVEKAITVLAPASAVHKTHHTVAISIRPVSAPPELPTVVPDSQQLASLTTRLDLPTPAAPSIQPRVSLTRLAQAQMDTPSYAAAASIRNQRAGWSSSPDSPPRKERSLGRFQKTAFSAAVYSLTYFAHEATEPEPINYGKR